MKLQILVPQYNETNDIIKPLLDSIAIQQNVEFEEVGVIICNDGAGIHLSEPFLKQYNFAIEYHLEPHRGVSGTRNACLDYATADYVMFCDADDMFMNVCSLYVIFMDINLGFDSLFTAFVEESCDRQTGKIVYITHERDGTFVHGKVHRRQYLIDKNIRWNEKLTIHEDSYFNLMCQNLTDNLRYNTTQIYLWKWRKDSVCRQDPLYIQKTYPNLIDSSDALVEQFVQRGIMDKAAYFVVNMVLDTYYTMNKKDWVDQGNKEYRDIAEKRFGEYVNKWWDLWESVSRVDVIKLSVPSRERNLNGGMLMESITLFDWLRNIKGE